MLEIMIIPLEYIERERMCTCCVSMITVAWTAKPVQSLRCSECSWEFTTRFCFVSEVSLLPTRPPNRQDIIQGVGCTNQGIL